MTLSPTQLDSLTEIPIFDPLPPDKLSQALGTPPFHPEASILNLRDLSQNGTTIPKAKIYRSGGLTSSAESTAWLSANVAKIFDLRGPHEHATTPDPHVAGVENVWIPPEDEVRLKNMMAEFAAGDGSAGWMTQYKLICRQYAGAFKAVLEHIRDTPEQPILFHCTAGRDRTGVLGALIHALAHTPRPVALRDYMLSRIELERDKEQLTALLMRGLPDGMETPGILNVAELRPVYCQAMEDAVTAEWGGWDGFLTRHLGFSAEDVERIKANLGAGKGE